MSGKSACSHQLRDAIDFVTSSPISYDAVQNVENTAGSQSYGNQLGMVSVR